MSTESNRPDATVVDDVAAADAATDEVINHHHHQKEDLMNSLLLTGGGSDPDALFANGGLTVAEVDLPPPLATATTTTAVDDHHTLTSESAASAAQSMLFQSDKVSHLLLFNDSLPVGATIPPLASTDASSSIHKDDDEKTKHTIKEDLMSSLMGGGGGDEHQGLFGGGGEEDHDVVSISEDLPPLAVTTTATPPVDATTASSSLLTASGLLGDATAVPPSFPAPASSLLSASGLLGMATTASKDNTVESNGGGGLFDDIDHEEEQREKWLTAEKQEEAARVAAERARLLAAAEEEERQRSAAAKAAAEAERLRHQQLHDQMQSIHLGAAPSPSYGYAPQPPPPPQPYAPRMAPPQPVYPPSPSYPQPPQQQYPQQQQQYPNPHQQYMYANSHSHQQQSGYPPMQQQQPEQQQPGFYSQPMMPQPQPQQQPMVDSIPVKRVTESLYRDPALLQQQSQQQSRYYQPAVVGSATAGMHGIGGGGGSPPQRALPPLPRQPVPPAIVQPGLYANVVVTEPMLLQSAPALFGIGQPPHWSYQITTALSNSQNVWMVRRRFRHVVALEDRLRDDCPGAILPPRPDKHATRALEEASAHQSAEFAMQRAMELQNYLNQLILHPIAQQSVILRLFLALQDDLGTAWPEVSSNALTRLANAGVGAAVKVSESTVGKLSWHSGGATDSVMEDFGEDNAELLALQNAESIRMGAVLQAVPKLEGAVTLLREYADQAGAVGMELGRLAKDVEVTDRELGQPLDMVSAGMLRSGRRSKRLSLEMAAALQPYSNQYKLCRYVRLAFADRRAALVRRHKERSKADQRAAQLLLHQRQQHHLAASQVHVTADRLAQNAAAMDDYAVDAGHECEEIGNRLKQEVNRIAWNRKIEWHASVKVIASAMKEAVSERAAIWETVREIFLQAFPEYSANSTQFEGGATSSQTSGPSTSY